ncbi:MAG TPA: AAA family ATPase [Mycobacteriales bacterium]|nr:AAA family ATPase [Mycobacteriales bacterium]
MSILLETDRLLVESLAPAVSQDTVVVGDMVALRRALADDVRHDLVVIGPDVEMGAVTDFTAEQRVARPVVGVVLVRRRLDTPLLKEAMRAGVREVVKADDLTGLTAACRESRALSRQIRGESEAVERPNDGLGRLITVFSAKGGCGKTTIATNLATWTAKLGKRTCLVDLDLAFGDVAISLQLFPERSTADLVALSGGIDRKAVSSVVTSHGSRLDTVLAPVEPGVAEQVTAATVADLLQTLKGMYDVVVVDTPPAFTDHVLAAFDASDHLALVTTLDIPALKNLKLTLETLDLLGYAKDRWHVVLNRADSKVGLDVTDVQKTLGTPITVQLPSSRAVPAAVNRGVALAAESPGHAVSCALRKFAERILGESGPEIEPDKPRRAPRKRGLRRRNRAEAAA